MDLYLLQIKRERKFPKHSTFWETVPQVFVNLLACERYSIYLKERFKSKLDLEFNFKKVPLITPPDIYKLFEDVRKSKLNPEPELWQYGVERDKEYY